MHTKEELDKAIIDLYNEYKESYRDLKNRNIKAIQDLVKINNEEKKYTREEVYYIGINALILLEDDIRNNRI